MRGERNRIFGKSNIEFGRKKIMETVRKERKPRQLKKEIGNKSVGWVPRDTCRGLDWPVQFSVFRTPMQVNFMSFPSVSTMRTQPRSPFLQTPARKI